MNSFGEALKQFKRDGFFVYQDNTLNSEQIRRLKASFEELDSSAAYQFHLINVRLDPHGQSAAVPTLKKNSIRIRRSDSSSSFESTHGSSHFSERIAAFEQINKEQAETKLTLSRNDFAKELLSVFQSGLAWCSIKIERVYFQEGAEEKDYLTIDFHRRLLIHLTQHHTLTTLSLAPFLLHQGSVSLGTFLSKNRYLHELSLGLTAGKLIDWEDLGLKLAEHPALKQVNFENTALNDVNCLGLLALAGNNYQTPIIFPVLRSQDERFVNRTLTQEYQALTERLTKTPEQRFKQEHLSEESILNLSINTLIKINSVQKISYAASLHNAVGPKAKLAEGVVSTVGQLIDATVNEAQVADRLLENNGRKNVKKNQEQNALKLFAYLIGRRDPESIQHSEEAYQILPRVYQANWNYLKNHLSLFKLNLNNPHPDKNKSIARFLLDNVYEIRSVKALRLLLETPINIFEPVTDVEEAFLVKVFKNNAQDMKPFRQALLAHIIRDDTAMGEIEKQLEAYPDLLIPYQLLIKHLDRYAVILHQREKDSVINQLIAILKSGLFFIWKEDTAAKRAEEFSGIRYHLEQSVQRIVGNGDTRPGSNEFQAARECFEKMIEISEKAQKGRFWSSNLHEGVMRFSKQLIAQLNKIQNKLTNQYKEDAEALASKQTELKEKHVQEIAKMKAEADAKQAEVDAKQAEAEVWKAEAGAKQAEAEVWKAEAGAKQAEAEAEIKRLRALLMTRRTFPQNHVSDSETTETGPQFFTARR